MTKNLKDLMAALKRLQSRFASVARTSRVERQVKLGRKPKTVKSKDHVALIIHAEKNHWLPHFHIKFKTQYSASYEIATGKLLAGSLPAKYEKAMLEWALENKALLLQEWNTLKKGTSTQLSLKGK